MTDEEKEAIECIEKIVSVCENHWKQLGYTCDLYDGDEPIPVNAYKTVLNLIEKQQTEINALQMQHEHDVKMIDEVKGEAVKLYRTIDEMAKIFIKSDYCFEITDHLKCNECINKNIGKQCEKCIKEYFKKKVEEK